MRALSQMRLPSTAKWLPRIPGNRITAGRSDADAALPARGMPRRPSLELPAHDIGPMGRKPAGVSCTSALQMASAERGSLK